MSSKLFKMADMKLLPQLLIILINLFLFTNSHSQTVEWIKQFGGSEGNDEATCIKTDNEGNVFVAGDFRGMAWDNAVNPYYAQIVFTCLGYFDMFIAKYNNSGNLLWVKQIKSKGNVIPVALSLDKAGNAYLTGWMRDTTYFGNTTLVGVSKDSLYATYFVAKYSSDGVCLWANQAENNGSIWGNDITTDQSNNVYTTGLISGKTYFGNNYFQAVHGDIFLSKYHDNGSFAWVKSFGSSGYDEGMSVSVGKDGSLYLSGSFAFTISFGQITLTGEENQEPNFHRMFLVKLDSDGNPVWGIKSGGIGNCTVNKTILDHDNNILMCGSFRDSIYISQTKLVSSRGQYADAFFAKFDPNGGLLWVKQIKGGEPGFDYVSAMSIAVDSNNNSYLYGNYSGFAVFGSDTLKASYNTNIFLTKYDANGNRTLLKQYGGSNLEQAYSIDVDSKDNIFISGAFWWSESKFDSFVLNSHGVGDAFFGKLSYNQTNSVGRSEKELSYQLLQNYPNPFNPVTTISYTIPKQTYVELKIFDMLGREITTLIHNDQNAGSHTVQFDGSSLPSGIYVYTIQAGQFRDSKKLLLLK